MIFRNAAITIVALCSFPDLCLAQGKTALAREAAQYVLRKFGKEAAEVEVGTLTRKIESLALKHGDDVFDAVRKVGPRTLRIVQEAGEHGPHAVMLMARYGDDALWVVAKKNRLALFVKYGENSAESMIKHGEIAEPLLLSFGRPAADAMKVISAQNGRRLAIMQAEGELAEMGRTTELLDVIAKYGDKAMEFVWKHRRSLTVAAALVAFLNNPEPFIDGTVDITKMVTGVR